jgi:hypothetical protein
VQQKNTISIKYSAKNKIKSIVECVDDDHNPHRITHQLHYIMTMIPSTLPFWFQKTKKKDQTSFKSQTFVPLVLFHPQTSSSNSHQSLISLQRGNSPILYLVIDYYIYTQTCIYRERKKRCSKVTFFKFITFFGILKVFELCHEIKLLGIV